MITVAQLESRGDGSAEIIGVTTSADEPGEDQIAVPPGTRPQTHYAMDLDGWQVLLRPACTVPVGGPAPLTITPAAGEVIRVTNEIGEAVESSAPITITSAGTVKVKITGAWPARKWSGDIEVTE